MPTILQINICANWGSTGRIAEQINVAASKEGWDTYYAYGRSWVKSESQLIHIGSGVDQKWHWLMTRLFDRHGLESKKATKDFIKEVERINPEIIHLQNIHGYYLNYPILFDFLKKSNIPVVWTLHDCWAFTGHCSHFVTANCEKWKTGCHHCPLKKTYPTSLLFDNSKQNYDLKKKYFSDLPNLTLVTVSHWLENIVKESFLGHYPIKVIHNGVDVEVFKPLSNVFDVGGRFKILGVSSAWTKEKGIEEFVKLSENPNYEVTLLGVTQEQKKKLPDNINCVLRTENVQQLVGFYNNADVLVNPTYNDSFPTINLESLACGTPVITYRTGGSPEAVTKGTGFVVEQGDYNSLVRTIEKIREETKEERKAQKEQCRRHALEAFDKDDCYKKYLNLYKFLGA